MTLAGVPGAGNIFKTLVEEAANDVNLYVQVYHIFNIMEAIIVKKISFEDK